jgi:hypothetical protein
MKSKINDPTYDFVQGIYMLHVPDKSELSNPFSANKRQRSKRIVVKTEKGYPEDVNSWTAKTFVDYFADEFKKNFNGFYKVTYTSDNKIINTISDFMEDNSLSKNEWTKKFIDWCFVNKEVMIKKNGHFLLMNLPSFLNRYYQDVVVSDHKTPLIPIYDEIEVLANAGKSKEIYSKYGIPAASTFYMQTKNIQEKDIISGLQKLFLSLSEGTIEDRKLLESIFQKSITRSPYIDDFALLDWREIFQDLADKFKDETWWRDEDYPGSPRFDYNKFLRNG